jgi:hypothetical protein
LQPFWGATAVFAESKIVADDKLLGFERTYDDLVQELPRRGLAQIMVETHDD